MSNAAQTYEDVAAEYYDPVAHPTCHNFNRLSQIWMQRAVPLEVDPTEALEVGAGGSVLAAVLHERGKSLLGLELQDASSAMLEHSHRWRSLGARTTISDACSIKRRDRSVGLLVASLGDPYNKSEFWIEAARVLYPGGQVLFTTPSYYWAVRFRAEARSCQLDRAEFVLRDGRVLELPSFVRPLAEQVQLMEEAGLLLVEFTSLGVDELPAGDTISPKVEVFGPGQSSLVWGMRAVRMPPHFRS